MVLKLFIGNDKLDLFKDENITIKSSIADTQDITKNTTDFTKTFTVPASDENNRIFNHYYDATIDNSFDARIKVPGKIELDGVPFKFGKFRLSKVKVKRGRPFSYTINFWGNLIDIKTKIGKDELKELDLSQFDHDFTPENVRTGLTSSLSGGDIIYNLLVKKQYFYNSNSLDNRQTDELANIALDGGADTGIIWDDCRPSIKVIRIIEAIETKYDLKFSRDFFGRTEFTGLYMWLDIGDDPAKTEQIIDWTVVQSRHLPRTVPLYVDFNTNKGLFFFKSVSAPDNRTSSWVMVLGITPDPGFEDVEYTLKLFKDGNDRAFREETYTGFNVQKDILNDETDQNGRLIEIFYTIESSETFKFLAIWEQQNTINGLFDSSLRDDINAPNSELDIFLKISENIPKINTVDFLKALFNMFKLVVIALDNGTMFVDNLQSFYDQGKLIDITRHIDFESTDVSRGVIFNEINFNYEEPSTILNIEFERQNKIAYGDEELLLTENPDGTGEPLDGDVLDVQIPFEQIIYERLRDLNTGNSTTNVQYGAIIDEERKPENPAPHLFYNINTNLEGKLLAFIDDSFNRTSLGTTINNPTHTESYENQQFSTLFSVENSTWNGQRMDNTLFSNYWQEYVLNIFNIKRRNFKFKADQLPLDVLTQIRLNDILRIKQDYYRIDNFDINLVTGKTNFNLVNAFEVKIGAFTPSQTSIFVDFKAQQVSIYVTFLTTFTFVKTDNGFGVDFITVSSQGSNIFFDFTENVSDFLRSMFIEFTDDVTGQQFTIFLSQEAKVFVANFDFSKAQNSQYVPFLTAIKN